jgi:hypothetical protein
MALGLASLIWSLVGHLYLGNAVLYQSFSGIFIVGGFAIGLSLFRDEHGEQTPKLFFAGLLMGLAAASDPLMSFPGIFLVITAAISPKSNTRGQNRILVGGSRITSIFAGVGVGILPIVVYLLFNNGLQDFYQNGIVFNARVYSNYAPPITLNEIFNPVMNILGIFEEQWRYYLSPFFEWTTFEFLDRWVFTGFFSRLSILLVSLTIILEQKLLGAVFVYLFGAMVLVRSETFFHGSPFMLLSLFCLSWLIVEGFRYLDKVRTVARKNGPGAPLQVARRVGLILVWLVVTSAFSWLGFRGGKFLVDNVSELSFSQNFTTIEGNAGFLNKATCGLDDARVLIYPLDPIQYFFAEIPPASKFHFMTPWVADVGQSRVIADLEGGKNLVYVNRGTNIWGHDVEEYLAEILTFLDVEYIQIEPNYFASPELIRDCPFSGN